MGNIVWLASYPKSGNTWLRAFLANLVADAGGPVPLADLPQFCDDEARPELFSALAGRPSTELTFDEICALRPRVHADIAARSPGTRLVKTHNCAGFVGSHPLHNASVTAGAIYVVRNPLDVAVSMAHHFGLDVDAAIERLGDDRVATANDTLFVTQMLGSWSHHVASWADLASARILVLRYEDLIADPVAQFSRAAGLLGLGGDRGRIERAVANASFETLASLERSEGFAEASGKSTRFFREGRPDQWREVLTPAQAGADRGQAPRADGTLRLRGALIEPDEVVARRVDMSRSQPVTPGGPGPEREVRAVRLPVPARAAGTPGPVPRNACRSRSLKRACTCGLTLMQAAPRLRTAQNLLEHVVNLRLDHENDRVVPRPVFSPLVQVRIARDVDAVVGLRAVTPVLAQRVARQAADDEVFM